MRTRSVTPVLALALLASLTACSASPQPPQSRGHAAPSRPPVTPTASRPGPGDVPMPLFIGGSVRGAIEQLGPDADVRLFDASGKHRTVGDGEGWKICSARQTPEQLIVFGAVMRNENC
ncbi:hypothetical protein [Actinacidiphila glaucinigra]|uniref:hypothetical protein n=1 Tax=Actinacidiphila glaucinigra TaxID=235986 RepID=UPI002E3343B7|nr:hypothetical protein [Actinacidiphila glaucinigra]